MVRTFLWLKLGVVAVAAVLWMYGVSLSGSRKKQFFMSMPEKEAKVSSESCGS